MKKTYIKILVLLMLPLLYYAIFTGFSANENSNLNIELKTSPPGPSSQKDFVNYILNSDYLYDTNYPPPGYLMHNFISDFRGELNFNGVHIYDADSGTQPLGWFNLDIGGGQYQNLNTLINSAHSNDLKAIY